MLRSESPWWTEGFTSEWWDDLPPDARKSFLSALDDRQLEEFLKDWRVWARDKQLAPVGEWDTWLLLAGRGFGKTRTAVETINDAVEAGTATRIAIVGQGDEDIRRVMIEGQSGFLKTAKSWMMPEWWPSRGGGILQWPNGATGFVYSAQDSEGLRGPEFDYGWFDEPMAVTAEHRQRSMDNLEFCLRLPPHPRLIITTTPKPHRFMKEMLARADKYKDLPPEKRPMVVTRGSTDENRGNLAKSFYRKIMDRYDGTNVGKQEIHAEVLGEEAGALWTAEMLDRYRVRPGVAWSEDEQSTFRLAAQQFSRDMERIVIGVDPNTKTASNHAAGIVPVGQRYDGMRFCLGDWSEKNKSPIQWAKTAVRAYQWFGASEIVAEVNNGGEMVRDLVMQVAKELQIDPPTVRMVHAKRDKVERATPIAALFEQGRAGLFGECGHREKPGPLYELESQMQALHDGFDPTGEDFDRVDALVWGMRRLGRGDALEDEGSSGIVSFETLVGAS
jgi:phage terminase large subunit-like protein